MSAALIAVVVSLLLGHVFPSLPSLRRYDWFIAWLHWLGRQAGGEWPNRVGLLIAVGLPLLAVGAAQFLIDEACRPSAFRCWRCCTPGARAT